VLELPQVTEIGDVAKAIGHNIAELIEDGATLQMGIGEIPDAVLLFLKSKRHLGIHTEMFSDGVVELFESGVITNEAKTLHRGKIVASFVLGSQKTFDFIDNNPFCEFRPSDYVNDPFVIAQNDKMVAINSALAVDITGQVCADSIGRSIYSGFGGQVDFIRGAARSKGGKPVIALPATAKQGTVSRIVDALAEGSGVVTTRADVHYVVTEFGTAALFGKSLRERAQALIAIAHPDFRDGLRAAARSRNLL
jgi:acetyl-CoA hydrolase